MTRSEKNLNMYIKHIQWRSDFLIFYFGTSKGNQAGERFSNPWHVYSNLKNTTICPALSLAKYIFSNPDILTTKYPLFPGNCQYDRFLKIFHKVIKDGFDRFQALGVEKGMLGAHSIIKEDTTIVATGCTVSLPMASIFLRDGWIMRPIKDQYIHYEKAGDEFVGRYVTGISSLREYFGISPVHWHWTDSPSNLKDKIETLIEDNLVIRIDVSGTMFNILKYLFACVCFHYEHLDAHLHTNHRIRASPIYIASCREKISTNMMS